MTAKRNPKHTKTIAEMEADLARAKKEAEEAAARAGQKETESAGLYAAAKELITLENLHYIGALDRYHRKVNGEDVFIRPAAMPKLYPEFQIKNFGDAFDCVMKDLDRVKVMCTHTVTPKPDVLNLLDMSGWVKPVPSDEHHWVFDVLMQSLGSGKAENINHLEHVICYHYQHPGSFMLPALAVHGEGGVGKNLLVDVLLNTVYGGATISAMAVNVVGQFNSLIKGKMVALINESQASRLDNTNLKDLLHKPRLVVNEKGVAQYTSDNLALFLIGANFDHWGGVMLDRSNADRRLSVLYCDPDRTMLYWIGQHTGWEEAECKVWIKGEGSAILSDRTEVGMWLHSLIKRYDHLPMPDALHSTDFKELSERQKHMSERVFEAVFNDPAFSHIAAQTLFDSYRCFTRDDNTRPLGRNNFYRLAKDWLRKHKPAIVRRDVHIDPNHKRTTFVNTGMLGGDLRVDNRSDYIAGLGHQAIYQGPELNWS